MDNDLTNLTEDQAIQILNSIDKNSSYLMIELALYAVGTLRAKKLQELSDKIDKVSIALNNTSMDIDHMTDTLIKSLSDFSSRRNRYYD